MVVLRSVIVFGMLFVLTGCGKEYAIVYVRPSPDGKAVASVRTYAPYWMSDQRLKVEVTSGNVTYTVYKDAGTDSYPCFAEIYWTPTSSEVAVFANNCYARPIVACFDVRDHKSVDCAHLETGLRRTIAKKYDLRVNPDGTYVTDPLEWAATMDARDEFHKRHSSENAAAIR
jgi:hypothetical protein